MDMRIILFIIAVVMGIIVVLGFIAQDIYLMRKIRHIEKQNAELRKENIGLMKHNGKLFDENRKLKNADNFDNIPDYNPW